MAKRKGSSAPSRSRARKKAAEEGSDAREAENAQCLDKLPQEVWRKIPANLENNDLFPLALSCRYFRQKQKELVERAIERRIERVEPGWGSWKGWNRRIRVYRPALKTTLLKGKRKETLPASAEYIKFCMKEEDFLKPESRHYLRCLASLHGHLPLLQELLNSSGMIDPFITMTAGESSFSQSLLPCLASDSFFSFSSQRSEANWRPCSGSGVRAALGMKRDAAPWANPPLRKEIKRPTKSRETVNDKIN